MRSRPASQVTASYGRRRFKGRPAFAVPMAATSVFLNVHDLDKALEFYRALGFKTKKEWKGDAGRVDYLDLDLQGADIGLGRIGANDDPGFRAWVGTPLGAGVMVYVDVPDVDKVWQRALDARLEVERSLRDSSYGRSFLLNDPDGYVISVTGPTKAPRASRRTPAPKASSKRAAGRKKAKRPVKRKR